MLDTHARKYVQPVIRRTTQSFLNFGLTAKNVRELTTNTFDDTVKEGKVLVDCWASWCGPCRIQMPIVEKLASELPNVTFGKVNVDEQQELAVRFGVQSIPTLLIFNNGQLKQSLVGVHSEGQLRGVLA